MSTFRWCRKSSVVRKIRVWVILLLYMLQIIKSPQHCKRNRHLPCTHSNSLIVTPHLIWDHYLTVSDISVLCTNALFYSHIRFVYLVLTSPFPSPLWKYNGEENLGQHVTVSRARVGPIYPPSYRYCAFTITPPYLQHNGVPIFAFCIHIDYA